MINNVKNIKVTYNYKNSDSKNNSKPSFTSAGTRFLDGFIKSQENLSTTRFIQDTTTNWLPKASLSRSKADFWEFTFLEFIEDGLFYFAAPVIGEHLYRKGLFKKIQPKNLRKKVHDNIAKNISQIEHSNLNKVTKNRVITSKAGMIVGCLAVPVLE